MWWSCDRRRRRVRRECNLAREQLVDYGFPDKRSAADPNREVRDEAQLDPSVKGSTVDAKTACA